MLELQGVTNGRLWKVVFSGEELVGLHVDVTGLDQTMGRCVFDFWRMAGVTSGVSGNGASIGAWVLLKKLSLLLQWLPLFHVVTNGVSLCCAGRFWVEIL